MSIPTRAGVMSFLLPGLGQVYLGKFLRAAIWFIGLLVIAQILNSDSLARWVPLAFGAVLGVFSAIDAVIVARAIPPRRV